MSNSVLIHPSGQTAFEAPRRAAGPDARRSPSSSVALRFLERFALIAFGLYHIPFALNNYPSLGGGGMGDGLAVSWGHVFSVPGIWVARHVLAIAGPMPGSNLGDNGDVAEEFGRLLVCLVVGVLASASWTFKDRRKPGAPWVPETLRVMLRYAIALGLISYALGKIVPLQFPPLRATQLEQRIGDWSPQQLLWTFMQYSRPYSFFGGLMECVVVALLCFRRTATLGAVICLAVMTNVAMLNWSYGVPVKLFSTMIVLSAAVIVAYDARRLIAVLVTGQGVPAQTESSTFHERIPRAWRWTIKSAAVGSVVVSSVVAFLPMVRSRAESSELAGAWKVTSASGPSAWRRLTIDQFSVLFRTSDADIMCYRQPNSNTYALALVCQGGHKAALVWQRQGARTLRISGTFDDAPASATTERIDAPYPLLRARFHLMMQ